MRAYHKGLCSIIVAEDWIEQDAIEKMIATVKILLLNGRPIEQSSGGLPVEVLLGMADKSAAMPEEDINHALGQRAETARSEQ